MGQYRKKPVVIEAHQWFKNGDHPQDGEPSMEGAVVRYFRHPVVPGERSCEHCGAKMHDHGWIDTLEGGHIVCPGDWVITGVKGERYPCKPDIFKQTYDATGPMTFGDAIQALKEGKRIARAGWNGKGQFVYLVPAASYPVQTGAAKAHFGEGSLVPYNAYLALKTVDERVSTWVPSVTDCLADDWTSLD
jgi:hypothetical protein